MTTREVIEMTAAAGIRLSRSGDRIRLEGPPGSLTPEVRETVAAHKPELLAALAEEEADRERLAADVERLGRMHQHLAAHASEWDDERWRRRRDQLLALDRDVAHRLEERGETWEDYGWCCTSSGRWHRTGEEPKAAAPDPVAELIRSATEALVPGALTWATAAAADLVDRVDGALEAIDGATDARSLQAAGAALLAVCREIAAAFREASRGAAR